MINKIKNLKKILKHEGLKIAIIASLNLLYLILIKYILRKKYFVRKIHNYKMFLDVNDPGISRTLALFGTREKEHIHILQRELKEGMVVLDIGANIGYYAVMEAALVGEQGHVYAIEPSPQNYLLLKKNVELNHFEKVIETFQIGISDRTGVEQFYLSSSSNLHTFHPEKYNVTQDSYLTNNVIDVATTTISDFAINKKQIDLIRMDIEGYEVEAFRGMLKILEEDCFSPKILFETHRPKYDDKKHSIKESLTDLFKAGYYVKIIVSDHEPMGEFRERNYRPGTLINTDFVKRGIYKDISEKDALYFISDAGYVRAVLLERGVHQS